jgi:hypothetical protein
LDIESGVTTAGAVLVDFYGKNVISLEEVAGCESESPKINEASFIRGGANGISSYR